MSDVTRRDLVKLAAGLAVGAGAVAGNEAVALEAIKPATDGELRIDLTSLAGYRLAEQVTTKIDDTGHSCDLVITSAILDGQSTFVYVRSNQVRVFRADAGIDEFTKLGGLYWRFGDSKGKMQFKKPGALVMVLRDGKGMVNWYSLAIDFRC